MIRGKSADYHQERLLWDVDGYIQSNIEQMGQLKDTRLDL